MSEEKSTFGPDNPHPLSTRKTELIWEGKYDEYGNRREVDITGCAMPMQKIETIDEPASRLKPLGLFDSEKAHKDDFRNMLIWGDNKLVMASLLKDFKGKIDLIYIDPPFDVGADFTMNLPLGDGKETIGKDQSTLEMVAYRDMWGKGIDSYLHMMYDRLMLMKELLCETGSIYIHCDWHVSHLMKLILDDIFGKDNFRNNLVWCYKTRQFSKQYWNRKHDDIFLYTKGDTWTFNWDADGVIESYSENTIKKYRLKDENGYYRLCGRGIKGSPIRSAKDVASSWEMSHPELVVRDYIGKGYAPSDYLLIDIENQASNERTDFATQKPSELVKKIILASSNEGNLIADFFCGSGTTGALAERLGRKWIMADLGRFAIHTTRKRMIELQRRLYDKDKPYRSFDVYNLGRYERQWWQKERLKGADEEHRRVVLEFYKAEILKNPPSPLIHGRKGNALCHVDNIDGLFTRDELRSVAQATKEAGAKEIHCLAWEFEMDLRLVCHEIEHAENVKVKLIPIPREIMEKNRKEPPPFLEVATLEAEVVYKISPNPSLSKRGTQNPPLEKGEKGGFSGNKSVDIKLSKFVPSLAEVPTKELQALKDRAMKSGFDFIDFWAIDFDYQDGQPFEHHWQAYRTRKDRSLPTVSDHEYDKYPGKGKYTACIKVVDIFGCDTSITVEVEI